MVEDRGPQVAAVVGLFLGLTWLFVLLRLYVKTFLTKSRGADDLLLIVSLIFFSTYCSTALLGVKYGTGRHLNSIPPSSIPDALYYWWLCELFYTISIVFIRLSIAVFLLQICVTPLHKNIIYLTLLLVLAFSIFYFFLVIFQCSPVSYFWAQYIGIKGHCINPAAVPNASIAHSVVSFMADWILGLLPVALIWGLKMNVRTKISVAMILSLGLLAGVATMIRVPYIKTLAITDNFLWVTTDVAIWSTIEPGLGIVAAAAATLRPLFRTFYSLTTRGNTHPSNSKSRSRSQHLRSQIYRNGRLGYENTNELQHIRTTEGKREWSQSVAVGEMGKPGVENGVERSPFEDEEGDLVGHGDGKGMENKDVEVYRNSDDTKSGSRSSSGRREGREREGRDWV